MFNNASRSEPKTRVRRRKFQGVSLRILKGVFIELARVFFKGTLLKQSTQSPKDGDLYVTSSGISMCRLLGAIRLAHSKITAVNNIGWHCRFTGSRKAQTFLPKRSPHSQPNLF